MTLNEMKAALNMVLARFESEPKTVDEWKIIHEALSVVMITTKKLSDPKREPIESTLNKRTIASIAREIKLKWPKPYYGAIPYLDAMLMLRDGNDQYGLDPAKEVVLYFLSNATSFKGEDARRLKAELKAVFGMK